ncbi:hypothetical protein [Methylocaldum gracile]
MAAQRSGIAQVDTYLLGGFAEPIFYLFALGYGLGAFIGEIEGLSYLAFLNAGILSTVGFFPFATLPEPVQLASAWRPLQHVVEIIRTLLSGRISQDILKHLLILAAYAGLAISYAIWRLRRRLPL